MTKNNTKTFGLVTGVLAVLVILLRIIFYFRVRRFGGEAGFLYLIYVVGFAAIAFAAFTDRRDYVAPAGFAALGLLRLITLVTGFFRRTFATVIVMPTASSFFAVLGYFAAAFVLLALFTDLVPTAKELCKKVWFVPAILLAIAGIATFVQYYHGQTSNYYYSRPTIIEVTGRFLGFNFGALQIGTFVALLAGLWAFSSVAPERVVASVGSAAPAGAAAPVGDTRTAGGAAPVGGEGFYSLTTHILLLLLTCGIWYYIWIYRTTEYLNRTPGEAPRSTTTELLLCMFVPFYLIFWVYKSAQRIDKLAAANGVQSDISTLCLILAIFIGIVPPIIMQDKINAIAGASSSAGAAAPRAAAQAQYPQQQYAAPQPAPVQPQPASVRPQPASVQPQPAPAQPSVADQLTQYKQLLDSGAITQEEYDAVKQRLLGL